MKAWQSTFNKLLNLVKSNLIFVDCFASRCVPNGNARNDEYNNNYAFSYAFNFEIISRNKNLKSNHGEKLAYTLEIKKEGNSKYAILSYGDEVKAKLTVGTNKSKDAKGYKFVLSHSKNVIRLKYKFNTSDKSKYVSYDKYAIFEQGKVVNSLLFKIIN
ncbi:hypothetical protein [uncultured Brachyspira sp.]|uniref:hypothetical protein n=1 Tax=uncultured Brachyspira sp. TaxID=221953 RepID=UPI0025896E21|nr:hypothetical protein [uncultured Brachyspira sp.]